MKKAYRDISRCRICGNTRLVPVVSLGTQALTGVFPGSAREEVTSGPVDLIRCQEAPGRRACGLVQLRQSYDKRRMYGKGYGYQSGLNRSMVEHLRAKARAIAEMVPLSSGDLVIDIGSNDGTLLNAYGRKDLVLVGIDPSGGKFRKNYRPPLRLIADFFSGDLVRGRFPGKKAKVVTSIAMFYDLDAPLEFMRQIAGILHEDGVWVMEQSYLPAMLRTTSYDTICHEHLEYYGVRQIDWMARRAGLKIVAVEENSVNGGSFSVTLAKENGAYKTAGVGRWLKKEERLSGEGPYKQFRERIERHKKGLLRFLALAKKRGETVYGYGASTKGNVMLQYCGLTAADIPCIGEVNPDKFGCYTPGTRIPIVPESQAKARRPDYLLVLPWHFRDFILKKEAATLKAGGRFLFPLPKLEVVS